MPKINEVMPVNIARYVADTIFLDSDLDCAYMHALLYQWGNGPLPNDVSQCARVMKLIGADAHEKTAWLLQRFFVQLEDGRWINLRNEAIKSEAEVRENRIVERNRKANESRWAGHERKWPQRNLTRILQGRKGANDGILVDAKQESQKDSKLQFSGIAASNPIGNPTGSANGNPQALPVVLELEKYSPSLRSGGAAAAPPVRPPVKRERAEHEKAKARRTPTKTDQDAPDKARTGNRATPGEKIEPTRVAVAASKAKTGGSNTQKQVRTPDPRFRSFRGEFFEFWKHANPRAVAYPWDKRDGAALNRLLRQNRSMELEQFRQCMANRAKSERVNTARPGYEWLDDLLRYSAGPLNRFNELK